MSLYHEAAEVLTTTKNNGGSLKSLTLGKKGWKSDAKTLYALTTEAAKWSNVLAEVVDKSSILQHEKNVSRKNYNHISCIHYSNNERRVKIANLGAQLSPTLALLLTHDLLLSRKGVALPAKHGLSLAVNRHKARLAAELTKARIRRGVSSIEDLRKLVNSHQSTRPQQGTDDHQPIQHPRWIRINTLRTTLEAELASTFSDYERVKSLGQITKAAATTANGLIYIDAHIPNLVAVTGSTDITSSKSYKEGRIILQEKASCFPAYLLSPSSSDGDIIDACAAPGNKTTHLAAILAAAGTPFGQRVTACEKDTLRSKTLESMVRLAGAEQLVTTKPRQDFLKLDPSAREFANVTALLLDPSCSGSGIVGRDEANVTVHLPTAAADVMKSSKGKKRKRGPTADGQQSDAASVKVLAEETADVETEDQAKLKARLDALSAFQLRLLLHAMTFPAARRLSYSTCSVHAAENEHVVVQALLSSVAKERGWRIMKREEQVDGMQRWPRRGEESAVLDASRAIMHDGTALSAQDIVEVADACIRCEKGGEEGTMGFFVAGFVRPDGFTADLTQNSEVYGQGHANGETDNAASEDEEWSGFSE